jgi:Leucine-rich repeat (LRR) protein
MKQILLMIAVVALVALVGCGGGKQEETQALSQPESETPPQITETPQQPKTTNEKLITDPIVEKAVRKELEKPEGELTEADFEKVTRLDLAHKQLTDVPKGLEKLTQLKVLYLSGNQLTDVKGLEKLTHLFLGEGNQLTNVKGLEKLTQLKVLDLNSNQLTDVKGLEKLTQLEKLNLQGNPDLTKAQIDELQKALPKCKIFSNPTK